MEEGPPRSHRPGDLFQNHGLVRLPYQHLFPDDLPFLDPRANYKEVVFVVLDYFPSDHHNLLLYFFDIVKLSISNGAF